MEMLKVRDTKFDFVFYEKGKTCYQLFAVLYITGVQTVNTI